MNQKVSQIKFDKKFLQNLLDKLKVGNKRSIHLNAVPGNRRTRLDVSGLNSIKSGLAESFLASLLEKEEFSFDVSFDGIDIANMDESEKKHLSLLSRRLDALTFENHDNLLEFGIQNFGFGFPLLIKRDKNDPSKIVKAPLFIWDLDIERSYREVKHWKISRREGASIKLNELLISHLSNDESVKLDKIPKEVLEDDLLDKSELKELLESILESLAAKTDVKVKLEPCLQSKMFEEISGSQAWIQWSGIFGIYRSQKETIIQATEELLENYDAFTEEDLVLEQFQTSTVTPVSTDPSKEEIINTLTKDEFKVIQGPPGTGKSQSITAIVSNALANNAKCLIVCEKKTALDVIYSNLEELGLGDLAVVIDDVNRDRTKIIKKARDIHDNFSGVSFPEASFDRKYKRYKSLQAQLNLQYAEGLKDVLGDYNWKDLIGLYIKSSRTPAYSEFMGNAISSWLAFNHEEYSNLIDLVEEAKFLFEEVEQGSDDIFSMLSSSLYERDYSWALHQKIEKNGIKLLETLKSLSDLITGLKLEDYSCNKLSSFSGESLFTVDSVISELSNLLDQMDSVHQKGVKLAGKDKFSKKGYLNRVSLKLFSVASKKNKKVLELKVQLDNLYLQIVKLIKILNGFGFDLHIKTEKEFLTYGGLSEEQVRLRAILDEKLKSFNNIFSTHKKIVEIEKGFSEVDAEIFVGIFEGLSSHALFDDYNKALENNLTEVTLLVEKLNAYESFHNWMFFLGKLNANVLNLINVLVDYDPSEWGDLFKAWYVKHLLVSHESREGVVLNKSDKLLLQLGELEEDLQALQLKRIHYVWSKERRVSFQRLSYSFNALYNLRKNKFFSKRNSLRKLIEKDINLFTSLFPVILTNPLAANAILPLKKGLFNVVIFDEASQLRVADTFACLLRGQYKIVAGDEHQMPPSNYFLSSSTLIDSESDEEDEEEVFSEEDEMNVLAESESLLEYAKDLSMTNKSYLDFHYRSKHPALIDFSNCAFYGGNLIPFPASISYSPIEFRHVNGIFDSSVNSKEMLEVLRVLKDEIHPDHLGGYPSIGVATFNIHQRNFINTAINEACEQDMSFANKMQELRSAGFFVKNLENIQGDEKDIIIVSTTYGVKKDGSFSQRFARLNRQEGYKLLNVLVTRAKKKLFMITSVPKEVYSGYASFIDSEGNNKRGIFYAYLAYAEAISNNEMAIAEGILSVLQENSHEKTRSVNGGYELTESIFEEEVFNELVEIFPPDSIVPQYKIGGFRVDFLLSHNDRRIVLECDGKAYHQSNEAYAYDMHRQSELERLGYEVYRIWSTNWFQDKHKELDKLQNYISIESK